MWREKRRGARKGWGIKRHKLLHIKKQPTRIYCTVWGIQPIFYNNYKWSIVSKDCDSLCCPPETYIILYIKYTAIKKKRRATDFHTCEITQKEEHSPQYCLK